MSKIVYFRPLGGDIWETRLDLESCPRRVRLVYQTRLTLESPDGDVVCTDDSAEEHILYLTADRRYVDSLVKVDSHDLDPPGYWETTPLKAAEAMNAAGLKLPPELETIWKAFEEYNSPAARVIRRLAQIRGLPVEAPPEKQQSLPGHPGHIVSEERQSIRRKKRDQGKTAACRSLYLAYAEDGRTPPTASELALSVGCVVGTASRAIQNLEDKYRKISRDDAKSRYRDHS